MTNGKLIEALLEEMPDDVQKELFEKLKSKHETKTAPIEKPTPEQLKQLTDLMMR